MGELFREIQERVDAEDTDLNQLPVRFFTQEERAQLDNVIVRVISQMDTERLEKLVDDSCAYLESKIADDRPYRIIWTPVLEPVIVLARQWYSIERLLANSIVDRNIVILILKYL